MAKKPGKQEESASTPKPAKRSVLSQSDVPAYSLSEALRVARALYDNFAGGPEAPHNVALAADLTPTGTQWRMISGAALAYGLITGSYSADRIAITPLARRIVAPTEEGDDTHAFLEAALKPRLLNEFFRKYDKNKFPRDDIARNVLIQMGVPKERVDTYLQIIVDNGKSCGILRDTKTGLFVAIDTPISRSAIPLPPPIVSDFDEAPEPSSFLSSLSDPLVSEKINPVLLPSNRVFISHGKNKKIVDQIKQILSYGGFDPVMSVDNETASKPVPDKVMDDMRSCSSAVIHVSQEKELLDPTGNKFVLVNQNVLIEIGASMALHRSRFVLLVEEGVTLPSNLQGMYECRYQGDSLDFSATMKLLKAFNEFKNSV